MKKLFLTAGFIGLLSLPTFANSKTVAQIDREVSHCSDNESEAGRASVRVCFDEKQEEYKKLVKTPRQKMIYKREQKKCYAKYGSKSTPYGQKAGGESEAEYGNRQGCYSDAARIAAKSK